MSGPPPVRLAVCAGEVSGDLYAAALVRELRRIFAPRAVEVSGIGGDALAAEGARLRAHVSETGVIGFWEVAKRARFFSRLLRTLSRDLERECPDALVTVDYPGLNLRLARRARALGIPAVHWVCPQVWAWRRDRIPKIAASVDELIALFPFEPALFEGTGLDVRFAGHPLVDQIAEFRRAGHPPLPWGGGVRVALFAGSRPNEVRRLLPAVLAGAALAEEALGPCSFLLPVPDEVRASDVRAGLAAAPKRPRDARVVVGRSRQVLSEARAAIVKSGTSTLEAALLGCPHAIVYRVSGTTYRIMKRLLVGVRHIGLPNIVAGRTVCDELIQGDCTPERLRDELLALVPDGPARDAQVRAFSEIREKLGGEGATARAAGFVADKIGRAVRAAAFAVALFAATAASALPAGAPRFSEETPLPSVGLSFSGMQGAVQKPVKPPEIRRWLWKRGDEERIEERADATELWRAAQTVGTWEDRKGNVLVLARALAVLPPALAEAGDVPPETFERAFSDPDNALLPGDSGEALAPWIARFAGCRVSGKPELLPIHPSRLAKVWEFPLEDSAARAYMFRLNASHAGMRKAPREWFALVLALASDPKPGDVRELDRMVRSDLLGSIRSTGLAAAAAAAERAARRRARTPVPGEGPPLEDERRAHARASVAALDDWWSMDSEHYVLLSDDPAAERSGDSLLSALEALRPHYAAAVPPFKRTIDSTSVVRVFENDGDYVSYLDGMTSGLEPGNTAGVFSPARGELVIRPARRNSSVDVGAVVRHEGFHQYVFGAWGGIAPSTWFNEGYADYFASFRPKGGGAFEWRETKWEAEALERMAEKNDAAWWAAAFRAMLLWDSWTFYNPPLPGGTSASYALAYGLVAFLERGAPAIRNKPYKDVLPVYMAVMEETGDPARATAAAFRLGAASRSDADFLDRLARDCREWWRSGQTRRSSRAAPLR